MQTSTLSNFVFDKNHLLLISLNIKMAIIVQHQQRSAHKVAKKVKVALKNLKKEILDDISQKIHDAKVKNDDKLPHKFCSLYHSINETFASVDPLKRHQLTLLEIIKEP